MLLHGKLSISIWPSKRRNPIIDFIIVLFPAPFGPRSYCYTAVVNLKTDIVACKSLSVFFGDFNIEHIKFLSFEYASAYDYSILISPLPHLQDYNIIWLP